MRKEEKGEIGEVKITFTIGASFPKRTLNYSINYSKKNSAGKRKAEYENGRETFLSAKEDKELEKALSIVLRRRTEFYYPER
jgi:RNA:NAD 2'-phosphotransferase (TPT1/KptA family)